MNEEVIADQLISSRLRARKALQGSGNFWEYLSQDGENTVPAAGQASIISPAGNQAGGLYKMAFKCSVLFALCLYAIVVSLGLIMAIAAGVHSSGPLSCPVEVEGNTGLVDNVVENTYHFDVLNPISHGVSISLPPRGGGIRYPPLEIKEGVVLGPMLLYIS